MKPLSNLFTQPRNLAVLLHDTAIAFAAVWAAFYLRIGEDMLDQLDTVFEQAALYAGLAIAVYLVTGLYRHVWAYVSLADGIAIVRATTIVVLLFVPLMFLFTRLETVPRSVPIISWFVMVTFLAAPRLAYRFFKDRRLGFVGPEQAAREPVLMIGAGDEAAHFIRATQQDGDNRYRVVGLVTANPTRVGQVIHGVDVFGLERDMEKIVEDLANRGLDPKRLIIARPETKGPAIQDLMKFAQSAGYDIARLPSPTDVQAYGEKEFRPRPIVLEDLLGRPARSLDRDAMQRLIKGRRVLVTGAGGSIGSELVRQIASADPSHLTLLDNGEFNLYTIEMEMREHWSDLRAVPVLADVRDQNRIRDVFVKEKPDLVFHAAALKHVPMVEANPLEGLATNALGTRVVVDACLAHKVPQMVLISSDKAVNPANVMGAGKRMAELYCQAADLSRAGTRFITVRFGNVLGSAGSVVPRFKAQLEAGGPLTVTHPDIERFFMTVGEAVGLVLQAAALGPGRNDEGAIYVLDMGAPVKIMDLARQVIRLSGQEPDEDVKIEITGLRPGEKLYEELFHGQEPPVGTGMDGILIARPRAAALETITRQWKDLAAACLCQDQTTALEIVANLVPELTRAASLAQEDQNVTVVASQPHLKVIK